MNMLLGVLVEVVSVVSSVERESLNIDAVKARLMHMLETCGVDTDGDEFSISLTEFTGILVVPGFAKVLCF